MNTQRDQIDQIKLKIRLSDEISKHTKIVQKGNDTWCSCIFHKEKTPSMKINDQLCSYYCFGCGAKGDVFTFYTDFLKYSFGDALKELSNKTGVEITFSGKKIDKLKEDRNNQILELASEWFHENLYLQENEKFLNYFKKRNISEKTISLFKLGYSSRKESALYEFLIKKSFSKKELMSSGLFKLSKSDMVRDFFYKRLIFPICDINSKVVGFGGRTIDNSEPKYINSSENDNFKKGKILFNLNNAKLNARKKQNLLVCEGYMDVISLVDKGIKSVVAPLGTSLTLNQLQLGWKYSKTVTLMFDGDIAGNKASIKSGLLALKYLEPTYIVKFLEIPEGEDPDTLINRFTKIEFIDFLKNPTNLSDFIFNYAKKTLSDYTPDQKISLDKYFDDICNLIQNKKVKYFYSKDFKDKMYKYFSSPEKYNKNSRKDLRNNLNRLSTNEILSILSAFINHPKIRPDLVEEITKLDFIKGDIKKCFLEISDPQKISLSPIELGNSLTNLNLRKVFEKSLNQGIYELFPFSSPNYNSQDALKEVKKSIKFIETRLSNSAELDKSLKEFKTTGNLLNWQELKDLSYEYISEID